ncbi:Putative protein of unknown function [Podospora comata]|uniref:RING-CH-type domain-containing protein n=1 Tax=Podospora comata TaxID=48703 RepID=A0ABY6SI29_PODCO|nr:Putative protein of unknown function [Podospora comata]
MVACDGAECQREWFRLECVAKWYCDECKERMADM